MILESEVYQIVQFVVLGVLARPFILVYYWWKQKEKKYLNLIYILFLLSILFVVSFKVVGCFYKDTTPNLLLRTVARLFYSFMLFSPFCNFFEYLRVGIKSGALKLKTILVYALICGFMLLLNRSFM